jgi:hypothetical protein
MPNLGDFGVTATDGWAAWVIRAVTRSEVNHAFVYVGNGNIVEAQPKGATLSPARIYPHAIWSHLDLTDQQRQDIAAGGLKLVGTPYSWVDVVCIGLARLFGWHVPESVRKRLNRVDRLECAQLVDVDYARAGVHLFPDGRIAGDVAPSDLLHLIEGEPTATASSQTDAAPITK